MTDLSNIKYQFDREDSKRARKYNAVKLPPTLNEYMIPKYVVYYKECYNREKNLYREFFKIERHPNSKKIIISSKSNKVSILEKLEEIKHKLVLLQDVNKYKDDHIEQIENIEKKILPKYMFLKSDNSKQYLMYDKKKNNENRETLRILYDEKKNYEDNLLDFREKILAKYNN
tara:strand:- start:294 stop:812 length:519 start_codon:yes stop_codon:yes gene_type:complete